jgi:hypothetical protein
MVAVSAVVLYVGINMIPRPDDGVCTFETSVYFDTTRRYIQKAVIFNGLTVHPPDNI